MYGIYIRNFHLTKVRKPHMASVKGKRTLGSIKELTDSLHQNPLGVSKVHLLTCVPAREPPQKMRGLGEF
jgi:hypothetical protein